MTLEQFLQYYNAAGGQFDVALEMAMADGYTMADIDAAVAQAGGYNALDQFTPQAAPQGPVNGWDGLVPWISPGFSPTPVANPQDGDYVPPATLLTVNPIGWEPLPATGNPQVTWGDGDYVPPSPSMPIGSLNPMDIDWLNRSSNCCLRF